MANMSFSTFIDRTDERLVKASRVALAQFNQTEDIGNFLLVSAKDKQKDKEKPSDAWLAAHEGFFKAVCWPWAHAVRWMDLDDLLQEARMCVSQSWSKYDTDRVDVLPTTYFWTCCLNKMRELYRSSKAYKRLGEGQAVSLNELEAIFETSDSADDDAFYYETSGSQTYRSMSSISAEDAWFLESKEEVKEIMKAVQALDERHRQCLLLHAQGFTQAEIAERIGRSQPSVSAYLKEARDQVRSELGLPAQQD